MRRLLWRIFGVSARQDHQDGDAGEKYFRDVDHIMHNFAIPAEAEISSVIPPMRDRAYRDNFLTERKQQLRVHCDHLVLEAEKTQEGAWNLKLWNSADLYIDDEGFSTGGAGGAVMAPEIKKYVDYFENMDLKLVQEETWYSNSSPVLRTEDLTTEAMFSLFQNISHIIRCDLKGADLTKTKRRMENSLDFFEAESLYRQACFVRSHDCSRSPS